MAPHWKFDIGVHVSKVTGAENYQKGWERAEFPISDIAELVKKFCWSPILWHRGVRHSENFWFSQLVGLDFDSELYPLDQAIKDWCDTIHIIGTTKSHRKEKNGVVCDRFRIVSVWDQPITDPRLYTPNLKKLMRENRAENADNQCVDLARFFYPCTEIVSVIDDGLMIEVDPTPPPKPSWQVAQERRAKLGFLDPWTVQTLRQEFPSGMKNTTCYRVAKDLMRTGRTPDLAYAMIVGSATYKGKVSPNLSTEIWSCIRSAEKSLRSEVCHG